MLYCECPFPDPDCKGAWFCDDIRDVDVMVLAYYDGDENKVINMKDKIDEEHLKLFMETCDENKDGSLNGCEVHDCVMEIENAFRKQHCPEFGYAYCRCPFPPEECPGAYNCPELIKVTDEIMKELDTNKDMNIDLGDKVGKDSLKTMLVECDEDMNG